jgi:hypothetical protein
MFGSLHPFNQAPGYRYPVIVYLFSFLGQAALVQKEPLGQALEERPIHAFCSGLAPSVLSRVRARQNRLAFH